MNNKAPKRRSDNTLSIFLLLKQVLNFVLRFPFVLDDNIIKIKPDCVCNPFRLVKGIWPNFGETFLMSCYL